MKTITKAIATFLTFIVMIMTITSPTNVSAELVEPGDTALICSTGTTLRNETKWKSYTSMFNLLPKTKVTVIDNDKKENGWSYISVEVNGILYYGYVPTEGLVKYTNRTTTSQNIKTTAYVVSTGTALRYDTKWSNQYVLKYLLPNTQVTILDDDDHPTGKGWSYVSVKGGLTGWVPTEGLTQKLTTSKKPSSNQNASSLPSGTVLGSWTIFSGDKDIIRFWPSNNPGVNNSWGNMCAAANKLETIIIKNGDDFFWYTHVGHTNPAYGPGGVLENGKPAVGYAGGICATVNAVKFALEDANLRNGGLFYIHTAFPHGKRSEYVPYYKTDCTVSYPSVDFGFKNQSGYDITFETNCTQARDSNGNVTGYSLTVSVIVA